MVQHRALGKGADALFERTKPRKRKSKEQVAKEGEKLSSSEVMNFQSYDVLTIRLRPDQLDWLAGLEKDIKRGRRKQTPRITKNTILRTCIDALKTLTVDTVNISDEKELLRRIKGKL